MKKKLLLILMLIAAVIVMPRVYADEGITLNGVTDITNPDTLQSNGTTTKSLTHNADNSVVTIEYDAAKFKLLDNGSSDGVSRPDGYAWIGFKVSQATGSTNYVVTFNGGTPGDQQSAADVEDYVGFKKETLETAVKAGKNLEFSYVITWINGNTRVNQTIYIIVKPEGMTLLDETDGSTEVWNHETYEDEVEEVMSEIYNDLEGAISVAKGIDTSKYTATSVKALLQAIEDAEAFGKDLTKSNQGDVRALTKAITTAIANLVVKGDEPVTPGSTTTDTNKPGEEAPDTFDAGLVYMGLALSAIGASVVSVRKLRNN